MPQRVLLVSPLPPPTGGIARWTVLMLEWMDKHKEFGVYLVDIAPRWRAVEDLRIWKRMLGGAVQGVRDAWRLLVGLLVFRPHLIHINSSVQLRGPWDTLVLALAKLLRVRSVYHLHMGRLPEVLRDGGWEWWGMRWALHLADRVVVLDEASEQALRSLLPKERVVRLPNAISLPALRVSPSISTAATVLYLGHVEPTKGMAELMTAWRDLRPQGWRLRLAGLGSGKYKQELLGIVGPEAEVQFLGDLSPEQAWAEMCAADIFVLPSHTEGFPYVILEAMAAGKAIVSTRVGAIAEMLDFGSVSPCGIAVEPRNSEALAAAIRQLMLDSTLRETLSRRASEKVLQQYTTDQVFKEVLGLWRSDWVLSHG
jgi:glycosyltransferase involved in cell wall biosynthesis